MGSLDPENNDPLGMKEDGSLISESSITKEEAKQLYNYLFKINGHLVQIGFTNNGKTAEDHLTNVLESLYI